MPWTQENACDWCTGFVEKLNEPDVLRIIMSHEKACSPLALFGEKVQNAFVGTVEEITCSGKFAVLARDQNSEDDIACWFHADVGRTTAFNRFDFGVYKEWNKADALVTLFIPKGIVYFKGIAAPQPPLFQGGGVQYYFAPGVIKPLFLASEQVRHELDTQLRKASETRNPLQTLQDLGDVLGPKFYEAFVELCKPAFEEQKKWQKEFRQAKDLFELEEKVKRFKEVDDFGAPLHFGEFWNLEINWRQIEKLSFDFPRNIQRLSELREEASVLRELANRQIDASLDNHVLIPLESRFEDLQDLQACRFASIQSFSESDFLLFAQWASELPARIRNRSADLRLPVNKEKAKKLLVSATEWCTKIKTVFEAATRKKLTKAIAEAVKEDPARGNLFEKNVPKDIRELLEKGKLEKKQGDEEPDQTPRHFVVHVSQGYDGEPDVGITMVVTYSHSTVERRGDIILTTHFYLITYVIQ